MELDKLIEEIENKSNSKSLSDEYLEERGLPTRGEMGIGEYSYGIVMIPEDWVLPYLKELKDIKFKSITGGCNGK